MEGFRRRAPLFLFISMSSAFGKEKREEKVMSGRKRPVGVIA